LFTNGINRNNPKTQTYCSTDTSISLRLSQNDVKLTRMSIIFRICKNIVAYKKSSLKMAIVYVIFITSKKSPINQFIKTKYRGS
jgi:hypothetical protein